MSAPYFELVNGQVYRRDQRVFEDLSLSFSLGEHVAILGPNGAGKTTLLKLITREIYPVVREDSACRHFGETNIHLWALRARMGLVSHEFQNHYQAVATGWDVVISAFFGSVGCR